jgi:deoxyadenosine/deoxycytidine kinase
MPRIALEGLIGIGKSTALSILQSRYKTAYEPLDAWTLLNQFYADKTENALAFEVQILCSYCHSLFEVSNSVLLMERSPDSAINVFAKSLLQDGHLTKEQYSLIQTCYETMPVKKADAIIFLDLEPSVCLERIQERNRHAETTLTLETLVALRSAYLEFIKRAQIPSAIIHLEKQDTPYVVAQKIQSTIQSLHVS